ncbi:MAG: FKBP-type peptidyl-prolyl cis-trans isomerase [Prevotella sp.]
MKKISFAAAMAIAVAALTSCGNSTSKPSLKNDVDTLSYTMGLAQSQGLTDYLVQMDIDTTYMAQFIKGLNDGANAGDDKKKAAYYMGIQIGQQISNRMIKNVNREIFGDDSTKTISLKNFMAGFVTGATGKKGLMSTEQAMEMVQLKMVTVKNKYMEKQYGPNKKAGEEYLAAKAKEAGVKSLPSGVLYKVVKEGDGPMPADTSLVTVNYVGKTIDGNVFDSSFNRKDPSNPNKNMPAKMRANQVIKGWTEALVHMPLGSVWEIYIPQELAYGSREQSNIKPFSALVFKIELIGVDGKSVAPTWTEKPTK